MRKIERTSQFRKDYKLAVKRGCNTSELKKVVAMLANGDRDAQRSFLKEG